MCVFYNIIDELFMQFLYLRAIYMVQDSKYKR